MQNEMIRGSINPVGLALESEEYLLRWSLILTDLSRGEATYQIYIVLLCQLLMLNSPLLYSLWSLLILLRVDSMENLTSIQSLG